MCTWHCSQSRLYAILLGWVHPLARLPRQMQDLHRSADHSPKKQISPKLEGMAVDSACESRRRSRSPRRDKRLSKALSKLLRHQSNLQICSDGFALVDHVIQALQHFPGITQEDVRRVVVQSVHKDGEPRLEISPDSEGRLWIRSRRNHTIANVIVNPAPSEQIHCRNEKHREHLSKGLSAILRHKKTPCDLFMTRDGYVPLDQVLQAMRNHRDHPRRCHRDAPSLAQVKEVVRTSLHSDGKPRFELAQDSGSGEMIRATRYHSIEGVNLNS